MCVEQCGGAAARCLGGGRERCRRKATEFCFEDFKAGVVTHTFNPRFKGQGKWISVSSRPTWSTKQVWDNQGSIIQINPVSFTLKTVNSRMGIGVIKC